MPGETWNEEDHPRDPDGKFAGEGGLSAWTAKVSDVRQNLAVRQQRLAAQVTTKESARVQVRALEQKLARAREQVRRAEAQVRFKQGRTAETVKAKAALMQQRPAPRVAIPPAAVPAGEHPRAVTREQARNAVERANRTGRPEDHAMAAAALKSRAAALTRAGGPRDEAIRAAAEHVARARGETPGPSHVQAATREADRARGVAPAPTPARPREGTPRDPHGLLAPIREPARTPAAPPSPHVAVPLRTTPHPADARNHETLRQIFGSNAPSPAHFEQGYSPGNGVTAHLTHVGASGRMSGITSFELRDKGGARVGTMSREYRKDSAGNLTLYHASFFMERGKGGAGIGADMIRSSVAFNKSIGVKEISVSAGGPSSTERQNYGAWKQNFDKVRANGAAAAKGEPRPHPDARAPQGMIGTYVWASFGFQWDNHTADNIGREYGEYLTREHGIPREKAQARAKDLAKKPWELAKHTIDGKLTGQHYLSNQTTRSMWKGTLHLDPAHPTYQRAKERLGLP